MRVYHELFTEEYFVIPESTRTNCIKDLSSLYALSKLKYSKHCWHLQYLLLLSGDINLHPGPSQYPCSVCTKAVRKKIVCCIFSSIVFLCSFFQLAFYDDFNVTGAYLFFFSFLLL